MGGFYSDWEWVLVGVVKKGDSKEDIMQVIELDATTMCLPWLHV